MKKNKGFTLIELAVTLCVVGILATVALPSFKSSIVGNRLLGEANLLQTYIVLARSEASRRNDYVSICASLNGSTCSGTDFGKGAIVFVNSNNTGLTSTGSANIIKIMDSFYNTSDKGKGSVGTITFAPTSAITTGTVLVCNPSYNSYTITVVSNGAITKSLNSGDGGC